MHCFRHFIDRRTPALLFWLAAGVAQAQSSPPSDIDASFVQSTRAIAGDRLAGLEVPASILTAADDPVIPVADFHDLQLPTTARLEIAEHGGHCGFFDGFGARSHASRWLAERLQRQLGVDG
jgi:pimeloyl-ACP methyl ester carboxylesterase